MEDYADDFDGDLTAAGLPLPLTPKASPSIPFETDALGPLKEISVSLSQQLQVPVGLVVPSVLSLASLATQNHAKVLTPLGIECPISLYFIRVLEPGARNLLVDNYVFQDLRNYERQIRDNLIQREEEKNSRADNPGQIDMHQIALQSMYYLSGLPFDAFMRLSQSLPDTSLYESTDISQFTANARGVLNRAQAQRIDNINKLWKGDDVILMQGQRAQILGDKKLSLKFEIPEAAAIEKLRTDQLGAIDLLSKSLICWPDNRLGDLRHYEVRREDILGLAPFHNRIRKLLSTEDALRRGPNAKTLNIETDALNLLFHIIGDMEEGSGSSNNNEPTRCLTENAAEIICRISSVLTIYQDETATSINSDTMACGCGLFIYYVNELKRLQSVCAVEKRITDAEKLLFWLRKQSDKQISENLPRYVLLRHLLQYGSPRMVKKNAEEALAILEDHQWIYRQEGGKKIYVKSGPIPARR